jgi:hypothetical protein
MAAQRPGHVLANDSGALVMLRRLVRARAAACACNRAQLHHRISIVIVEINDLIALSVDGCHDAE